MKSKSEISYMFREKSREQLLEYVCNKIDEKENQIEEMWNCIGEALAYIENNWNIQTAKIDLEKILKIKKWYCVEFYKERHKSKNKRIAALELLLDWAIECGLDFEQIFDNTFNWDEFEQEIKNKRIGYKESMIYYAERWIEKHERE